MDSRPDIIKRRQHTVQYSKWHSSDVPSETVAPMYLLSVTGIF